MAIQERVSAVERAVARLAEEGALRDARMEKAFDRLSDRLDTHAERTARAIGSVEVSAASMKTSIASMQTSIASLEADGAATRTSIASLEADGAATRASIASLEADGAATRASIASMQTSIGSMEADGAATRRSLASLEARFEATLDGMRSDTVEMKRKWGELANRLGTLVEDIVAPNVRGVAARYFDSPEMDYFSVRVFKRRGREPGTEREFDVVAYTPTLFFLVEVKTDPRADSARDFVELLAQIPAYFPESTTRRLIPIFSAPQIPDSTLTYLTRQGVYCLVMGEDNMSLANYQEVEVARRGGAG